MKVGDIIKPKYYPAREYEVLSRDGYHGTYKIKCIRTPKSSELMKEETLTIHTMSTDFELVKSAQKPIDKAYDKLTQSFKVDFHGNNIAIDKWNKLYCSCSCNNYNNVRVLHVTHKICTGCKKEKI